MEMNVNQNLEQGKKESLNSLAFLLRLFLNYKQTKRKEKVYAWIILCSVIITGTALFYLIILKSDIIITGNKAKIKFVVYSGDSIENTATNIAKVIYRVSKKYDQAYNVTVLLYITHNKIANASHIGNITEAKTETNKYNDIASYVNARREFFASKISSLKDANFLK
jgi:hypothetical protein